MKKDKISYVFQRVEKKYLLDDNLYNVLLGRIEPYIIQDQYGLYTICNIYFDTDTYDITRYSIEMPIYKEKLRLRSYGIPGEDDTVFLEIKKKWDGVVFKRRVSLSLKETENYLDNGVKPQVDSQIFREIDYFIQLYKPKKKFFLAYDRTAYYAKEDKNIRITFDHSIRSRMYDLDLKKGDYGEPLLKPSTCLMEVKVLSAMPLWLARILSDLQVYPVSFSKVGNVYKNFLMEERGVHTCSQVY